MRNSCSFPFKPQLQTGKVDMPSVSRTFKGSGAVTFDLEERESSLAEERNQTANTNNRSGETDRLLRKVSWAHQSQLPIAKGDV